MRNSVGMAIGYAYAQRQPISMFVPIHDPFLYPLVAAVVSIEELMQWVHPGHEVEMIMRTFLLWDHDGVLVDTERWYFVATQACLRELGVELDQATYLQCMAVGRSCWELARDQGQSEAVIAAKRRERDRRYRSYLATRDIEIDGVLETLRALRTQYRMAIVSTSKCTDMELIHRERGILPYFEFVLTIEDYKQPKPAPEPYHKAL